MTTSAIRESDGNVVLRSDNVAIRLFKNYGFACRHWFQEPFQNIINDWPGSACSVNFETGQDPTQASANGITENPASCLGMSATDKYYYYIRESLLNTDGTHEVTGFLPDFWLSAEGVDDYPCPTPGFAWNGWQYNGDTTISFKGSNALSSGIFCPGNEIEPHKLRVYRKGRIAFKTRLSLLSSSCIAGFMFRKNVSGQPSKDEFYHANGYHWNFNKSGQWSILKQISGIQTPLANGVLSSAHLKLLTSTGLLCEIRTYNDAPGRMDIMIEGSLVRRIEESSPILGESFGLFASCSSGSIKFSDRQVFDLNCTFKSRWQALPGGIFKTDMSVIALEPMEFYRANFPGAFLNQFTFPVTERSCKVSANGTDWIESEGVFLTSKSFLFCGNKSGSLGLCVSQINAYIDGSPSVLAHSLLQKQAINNEFVLMLNPLPANTKTLAREIRLTAVWSTKI